MITNAPLGFSPPVHQPVQWRRALNSLRGLLRDPNSTEKAFDVFFAIGRDEFESQFQRFSADPEGKRLLAERPSLVDVLADRDALARLPEGSLGRAYLDYLVMNRLDPRGLVDLQKRVQRRWEREDALPALDADREWFRDRSILMHDVFHVLTGLGTDPRSEATLLAFSLAQLGGRANALLTVGATLELSRRTGLTPFRNAFRAWMRGRRAAWLPGLHFEKLLSSPLDSVRRLVRVQSFA